MTYTVKEIFLTVQGEGAYTGVLAVFVRFAGCNLWSGREEDRAKAICNFCDTDFVGGKKYELLELVHEIVKTADKAKLVVLTGGEPGLQVDTGFVRALKEKGFYVAIETNGTVELPSNIDWIVMSPKAGTKIVLEKVNELKIVYPQPINLEYYQKHIDAEYYLLSPKDGPHYEASVAHCMSYVRHDPTWRVNIQAHKFWRVR